MDRWAGKVAVVTGASAGIGKNVAERLVEEGLQVVGLARRLEIVEELSRKLVGKSGKLFALKCDVSNEDEVKNAFDWVKKNVGPVSILINNAGTAKMSSLIDGDPKIWKQIIDVNLYGIALCAQQAALQMKEAKIDGHIININSIAGHKISDSKNGMHINMYNSSKYGVTAYTEVMRQELRNSGSKTKITSISPGLVLTDFFSAGNFPVDPELLKSIPHLFPEDITDAIMYALGTKPHVQIHELTVKPIGETF